MPAPIHCTHHPRLGFPGERGAPLGSGPEEKGIRACQDPAGATRSLKPTQPGRVSGSKILIFPFWGHSMTSLPLLFLCAFSLGWLSPTPRISPSTHQPVFRASLPLLPDGSPARCSGAGDRRPRPLISSSASHAASSEPFASRRPQRPHPNKENWHSGQVRRLVSVAVTVTSQANAW